MSGNFDALPEEKRGRVYNAGFTCFGQNGYRKTAMSEIAAAAGVSKAALFHYFGSKEAFYLRLFRYASEEILAAMPEGTGDLFECIELGTQVKLCVMKKHPGMYEYLLTLVKESDESEIEKLQAAVSRELAQGTARLMANVDWSRLRPDIDRVTAMNILRWVSDGHLRSYRQAVTADEIMSENRRYMSILRRALYREEFQ